MTSTQVETYDFTVTATLRAPLAAFEHVGNGQMVARRLRAGLQVTITYYLSGRNCGIHARRADHSIINREIVADPAAVLAATGIDVRA